MTLTKIAKGRRVKKAERDKLVAKLVKRYQKGASIRVLAEEVGRSYGFIHRLLSEAAVEFRSRGGAQRTRKRPPAPDAQRTLQSQGRTADTVQSP